MKRFNAFLIPAWGTILLLTSLASAAQTGGANGPVAISVQPEVIVKDALPACPIGVSENLFYSSDKHYPNRRHSQAETLRMLGGKTIRGMEGNIGDFIIWSMPPFAGPNPHLTCYQPGRGYFNDFYNADGTLRKAMDFGEYIATGQAAGVNDFFYIIGIDAINAEPGEWQWIIPKPLETITAGAGAQARWCQERGLRIWFEIGNENDLNDGDKMKLRKWVPEHYASVTVQISRAIKAAYPQAKVGINGGFATNWFDQVIPKVWQDIDFVVAHAYSPTGKGGIWRANTSLDRASIPDRCKQEWPICVTETSSYRPGNPVNNDLEEATRNFIRMGINLCEPRVKYMHFWTDRAADCAKMSGKNMFTIDGDLLPMGKVLAIWNEHLKSQMVKVETGDKEIFAFATRNPQTRALTLFLANQGKSAREVTVKINGSQKTLLAKNWTFTGTALHDRNPRWEKLPDVEVRAGSFARDLSPLGFTMVDLPAY
ncbi:MAG: hypothetical protein WCO56_04030 [Verrucomicrobiota bacterium]